MPDRPTLTLVEVLAEKPVETWIGSQVVVATDTGLVYNGKLLDVDDSHLHVKLVNITVRIIRERVKSCKPLLLPTKK